MTGAFSILEFPLDTNGKEMEPPVVYLESATGAIYLDKSHEAAAYNAIWADMAGRTLNESRSKSFIQQVAEEYSRA
ncbi:hypothetical protein GCM10010429_46400 [Micromonospora olivasterospora]|uniref:DUF5753 domain-containing protein n=1 Tax=Micromonospora olivasterospora TaxID=1880 RepID=A0A562I4G3_MICOL|nr:Scr1 family TA system antitoxin-like transcriptional regulator [Micromonospora olivasterospora]TWH65911.1 hypothetical protein JD77_00852 [Micromonospora olivasterospora]